MSVNEGETVQYITLKAMTITHDMSALKKTNT